MKQYRLVEAAPENGERYGKQDRRTLFAGGDKAAFLAAIDAYHAQKSRRPWSELVYYHGSKRIYPYEF